jgi:hypothetical protein
MVILMVVDITGYEPRLVVANLNRHEPCLAGAIRRPFWIRQPPEVTRQVLAPGDKVVTIEDNAMVRLCFNDVRFTTNPARAVTRVAVSDRTPSVFTEYTRKV